MRVRDAVGFGVTRRAGDVVPCARLTLPRAIDVLLIRDPPWRCVTVRQHGEPLTAGADHAFAVGVTVGVLGELEAQWRGYIASLP